MIEGLPLDRGPIDGGWVTLDALATYRFDLAEAYFVAAEQGDPGLDRRGQGAYFVGGIAFYLAAAFAAVTLRGGRTPDIAGDKFAIRPPSPASPLSLTYRLAGTIGETERPVGEILQAALSPLIERVRLATRLAEPAQWRLVADGIASAFLYAGNALGCSPRAQTLAMSVVRDPRYRVFNGHTGYHQLTDIDVYLRRGGCCRYYTCNAGSYCANCVLRPPQEQLAELAAALANEKARAAGD